MGFHGTAPALLYEGNSCQMIKMRPLIIPLKMFIRQLQVNMFVITAVLVVMVALPAHGIGGTEIKGADIDVHVPGAPTGRAGGGRALAGAVIDAPAPAPAPSFENVTQSLVFGGEYSAFIELLVETKLDAIFQSIANDSEGPGITIFAPTDDAFKTKLVSSLLKNLTASQKVSLVEYHALNAYQPFKDLQNANNNVTSTFATFNNGGGGRYHVNITFTGGGRLQISSGWTTAKISTTVYSKKPVSIFAIDQVLLPDEIFGLPPPPPPPSPLPPTTPSPSPSASSSPPLIKPTSTKDSSFSSPLLFTPCFSSLLFSFLLFQFVIISSQP